MKSFREAALLDVGKIALAVSINSQKEIEAALGRLIDSGAMFHEHISKSVLRNLSDLGEQMFFQGGLDPHIFICREIERKRAALTATSQVEANILNSDLNRLEKDTLYSWEHCYTQRKKDSVEHGISYAFSFINDEEMPVSMRNRAVSSLKILALFAEDKLQDLLSRPDTSFDKQFAPDVERSLRRAEAGLQHFGVHPLPAARQSAVFVPQDNPKSEQSMGGTPSLSP